MILKVNKRSSNIGGNGTINIAMINKTKAGMPKVGNSKLLFKDFSVASNISQ